MTHHTPEGLSPQTAEDYLRGRYGAYRGHFAWRELEEAFNAGLRAQAASVPVAYRVDWPVEAGLGLPRFFGADDRERMDNWVRDRECTVHPLVYAGAPPAPASVPVLVASVMGLDVYDTPNGEPAQAVDAVGEQNSFERARERGTFSPPLDYCPTWYATELRMEGWLARAALTTKDPK